MDCKTQVGCIGDVLGSGWFVIGAVGNGQPKYLCQNVSMSEADRVEREFVSRAPAEYQHQRRLRS